MKRGYGTYIILALALGVLVWGISDGEHLEVLDKATTLCLECLGLR